ncbi:hypothetical protein EG329_004906 [Mollisiaceae sp. DMI_Dod_QoI]|nr:hypothetical protein EG329_004906 [Helotiales sp. DMI_Dod_QoI]
MPRRRHNCAAGYVIPSSDPPPEKPKPLKPPKKEAKSKVSSNDGGTQKEDQASAEAWILVGSYELENGLVANLSNPGV